MLVVIVPGIRGSMACLLPSGKLEYTLIPNKYSTLRNRLLRWATVEQSPTSVIYVDEFYALNNSLIELERIDMAEYAHDLGVIKGIAYGMSDFVIPIDTRELLMKEIGINPRYDLGPISNSQAARVAYSAFPSEYAESNKDLFTKASVSIAALHKIVNDPEMFPSIADVDKIDGGPFSPIFS